MTARAPRRTGHPIYLAPFGLYSRYMLGAYLRHILMVVGALMTIALTIDLWPQVRLFAGGPVQVAGKLVWLACLRLPDLLPPFVPFATFLGVVWCESAFTESRERLLIWNSGRSPLLCLMPALFAGILIAGSLLVLDGWLRPAAIHVQMAEKLGREGLRLDRSQSGGNHWIALPDGLLRAEITYGPPLTLHDVTIYKLDSAGHLAQVDTAAIARPLTGSRWLLEEGQFWQADFAHRGDVLSTGAAQERETPFHHRILSMALNQEWLRNLGLSPQYLRFGELRRLAHAEIIAPDADGYKTRLQTLFGETLFTVMMALLAASLSMLYFAYATRWFALVTVLVAGYLAHFAAKAFSLMGEFGYVAPFWAGWLVPLLLIAALIQALLVIQRKRGGRLLAETPRYAEASAE